MWYVYVLKIDRQYELYVGSTGDLRRRLAQHLKGHSKTTKDKMPTLVYYEAYDKEKLARQREQKLKQHGAAYQELKKRIFLKTP